MAKKASPPVSVLVLTLDEEQNLPRCLKALTWCDDIVVLDSYSSDATVDIAKQRGARVMQRRFDDFASQRNFALDNVDFKHPWVFHLDADEVFTPELRLEVERAVREDRFQAFRVPSKTMFQGRWLRYSGMYPTYQVRLARKQGFRFRQVGHGQKEDIVPEKIGTIRSPYLHYSFSKGMSEWFEKHNRYSSQEAAESLRQIRDGRIEWKNLFRRDSAFRRGVLRQISCHLPCRSFFRFGYMFFLRFGFLDGIAGFRYCCLLAVYEFMIDVKIRELREIRMKERKNAS